MRIRLVGKVPPPRETGDPPTTGRRDNSRCPQPPPGDDDNDITEYDQRFNPAGDRTTLLGSVELKHVGIRGDGNCLPYSVLQSAGQPVSWEAAIKLREEAIVHAKALPRDTQIELRLCRPVTHPHDPMGNDLNHREVENVWPIAAQAKYRTPHFRLGVAAWMNDNMLHSMCRVSPQSTSSSGPLGMNTGEGLNRMRLC
jgi:hypothetical protein